MANKIPYTIGPDAIPALLDFCAERGLTRFTLIADRNTYGALGQRVDEALRAEGADILPILLEGDDIIADARYVMQVMVALDRVPRTFLAVGSGTLTDITRFVSHRSGAEFISLPTAPSVDGYTSIGAPIVIDGVKVTIPCHGPLAVFADLPTLCAAPQPMLAAGVGDMLAKYTSTADWELDYVLIDEKYDPAIAARMRAAAQACAQATDAIATGSAEGLRVLMDGLIESGLCMLDFGATLPASGGEHHISHFLEMKLLQEGRHSILHGAKVGIGVLTTARRFDALKRLSLAEVEARLKSATRPEPADEIATIRAAYGAIADQVIAIQQPFLEMTDAGFEDLKARILARWDDLEYIAAGVPGAAEFEHWIGSTGGAVTPAQLGLSDEEVALAARCAHYLKPRVTINRLSLMLGIP